MEAKYSFVTIPIAERSELMIKIDHPSGSAFAEVINDIRDEQYKDWFMKKLSAVIETGTADIITGEHSGIYAEQIMAYFYDNLNQKVLKNKFIETEQLRKIIEAWWQEYSVFREGKAY